MLRSSVGLLAIFSCAPAWATTVTKNPDELSVLPVIYSLFAVLITIVVLALVFKKFNLGFPGSRSIKVVSALSLGTKERLVVIEVNGQQHMLGVTSNQINHLLTLEEPLNSDSSEGNNGQQGPMTFKDILENLGKKQ